mgnify:CR=1 FL=1
MSDPEEPNFDEEPCASCTTRGCQTSSGCDYQTDFDKMLGIYSFRDAPADFALNNAERARAGLPPIPGNDSLLLDPPPSPSLDSPPDPDHPADHSIIPIAVKRKPGRPPSGVKKEPQPKKTSGGQPGNLNALKHGLYAQGNAILNTSPLERAQLFDLQTAVNQYKTFITKTYENGLKQTDMNVINETMHTLSVAAIALTRLLQVHDQGIHTHLPFDRNARINRSAYKLINFYNQQIASFMGQEVTPADQAPPQ